MFIRALFLLLALAAVGCGGADEPRPVADVETGSIFRNTDAGSYVGDEACASCHEDLYTSYQSHGMAQSLYALTPDRAVERYGGAALYHEASGFYYRVYEREGVFFQEEYRQGPGGRKTHQLVRQMDFVVGSGTAARTYLTKQDDLYYELPLTWYTQADGGRGRWDFSPGYREANGRFDRTIPARCMACHNGASEPVSFVEGAYASIADGIGCERCHGPGSIHVEARLADPEAADSIDYTIVNPAHLSLDLRLDVCQQCHLNGTVSILREGKEAFGYVPSEPLAAHVAHFDVGGSAPGTISVISHADRMKQSACFVQSSAMDCVTCHNPHEGFRDKGPEYFNATCQGCHEPATLQAGMPTPELRAQHASEANCFACHMPKVEADDAPHSSFTDHFIRVVRAEDRVQVAAETGGDIELESYFPDDQSGQSRTEGDVYEGMAYVIYGRQNGEVAALDKGIATLERALAAAPHLSEGHYLLGFARMQRGRTRQAIPALQESIRLKPGVPERLNALAQAYEATGGPPNEIERLYREALSVQPALADVRLNYGRFLETQGRVEAAAREYREALGHEPWLASAHYNLGTALLRLGSAPGEAVEHLENAIHLEPDYVDALVNLAIVRAGSGDEAAAGTLFRRAVEAGPNDANALSNLGMYQLQRGALAEAAGTLERASAVAPDRADVAVNLAVAYFQLGNASGARQYAQQALRLDPGQPTAQQVLNALP
ncbi:MAG: tetratricopeptide repeat protein [Bacteroidota bacterium]